MLVKESLNYDNLQAVAELEKECFGKNAWSKELLANEIGQDNKHYTVIVIDGEVAGYGGFSQVLDEGDIMNIAIFPRFRRQGLASMILSSFFEQAETFGIKSFTLEVRDGNLPAKQLYEKSGFVFVGKRTGYYSDGEDACIYWKYM